MLYIFFSYLEFFVIFDLLQTKLFVFFSDEREDVQKKTFAKWINSQLSKGQHSPVTDLFYDLRDGTRLLALLEVLTSKTFVSFLKNFSYF